MEVEKYRKYLYALLFIVAGLLAVSIAMSKDELSYEFTHASKDTEIVSSGSNVAYAKVYEPKEQYVIPCGYPIGIYVKTEGVMVIDVGSVRAADGSMCSPCENILKTGDYILKINGIAVEDKKDLIKLVSGSNGSKLSLEIKRDNKCHTVYVTPAKNENDTYMLGVWVKDDISGIGTLTYVDENGFAALGHSINDNDTGEQFCISEGAIYETQLLRIVKADGKHAGRLEGMIDYENSYMLGVVWGNDTVGIQGKLTRLGKEKFAGGDKLAVASKDEVHIGKAQILSWITGEPQYYDIEITDIQRSDGIVGKNLEIKIIDEQLLQLTSGIVQGLSGTPIIQDGKLAGAVTHVFLKDSTMGYGVFAEDMIE